MDKLYIFLIGESEWVEIIKPIILQYGHHISKVHITSSQATSEQYFPHVKEEDIIISLNPATISDLINHYSSQDIYSIIINDSLACYQEECARSILENKQDLLLLCGKHTDVIHVDVIEELKFKINVNSTSGQILSQLVYQLGEMIVDLLIQLSTKNEIIVKRSAVLKNNGILPLCVNPNFHYTYQSLQLFVNATDTRPYINNIGLPFIQQGMKEIVFSNVTPLPQCGSHMPGQVIEITDYSIIIKAEDLCVEISNFAVSNGQQLNLNLLKSLHEKNLINTFDDIFKYIKLREKITVTQSIAERFDEVVFENDHGIAIKGDQKILTYHQLRESIGNFASILNSLEIKFGNKIAFCVKTNSDIIALILAILKLGCTYIPIHPATPLARVQKILEISEASLLILEDYSQFDTRDVKMNCSPDLQIITVADLIVSMQNHKFDTVRFFPISPETPAYLMFTSGSTGEPKGVIVTHHNVIRLIQSTKELFNFKERERWSLYHSLSFDFSVWEIFGALLTGGTLVIPSDSIIRDIPRLSGWISQERISILSLTPSVFDLITLQTNSAQDRFDELKYIFFGGESLRYSSVKRWYEKFSANATVLVNMYGITEATVHSTFNIVNKSELDQETDCIGYPLPDVTIYLLDKHGMPVKYGQPGNIVICGSGVTSGYINSNEKTLTTFKSNHLRQSINEKLFYTGDRAFFNKYGQLCFIGRADNIVKISGYRVDLDDINSHLLKCPEITNAFTIAHIVNGNTKLISFVASKNKIKNDKNRLLNYLRSQIPYYMLPSDILISESLPLTSAGKIDRNLLIHHVDDQITDNLAIPASRNTLKIIWNRLLGNHDLDDHSDFFQLGGSSLTAMRLAAEINNQFDVNLSFRQILEARQFGQLLNLITHFVNIKTNNVNNSISDKFSFPASIAQKSLWYLDNLYEGKSIQYNIGLRIHWEGTINVIALREALKALGNKHLQLKTSFQKNQESIIQTVDHAVNLNLEEHEISEEDSNWTIRELARKPFDLSSAPLGRFVLFRLSDNKHLFIIILHHIIHDGWSFIILLNDLAAIYHQICNNKFIADSHLPAQYSEFVHDQYEIFSSKKWQSQINYWKNKLKSIEPIRLPMKQNNIDHFTTYGSRYIQIMPSDIVSKCKKFANDINVTFFTLLLSAKFLLLYRYTQQSNFAIGITIANRNSPSHFDVVGLFTNALAITADLSSDLVVINLIKYINNNLQEAYAHSDVPFMSVVEALKKDEQLFKNPIFQVMLTYHDFLSQSSIMQWQDLTAQYDFIDNDTAKFDLNFEVIENGKDITIIIEYNNLLFDNAWIEKVYKHYINILELFAENPYQKIIDLNFLSHDEQHKIRALRSSISNFPHRTILDKIITMCVNQPYSIAIEENNRQITYQELLEKSAQVAYQLCNIENFRRDTKVIALLFTPGIEMIITILAMWRLGYAYLPIDPRWPVEKINHVCKNAGIRFLVKNLDTETINDLIFDLNLSIIDLRKLFTINLDYYETSFDSATMDDIAYVIYTSGTTQHPKGVPITHKHLSSLIDSTANLFNINANDTCVFYHSYAFDFSIWEIFSTLTNGAKLIIPTTEEVVSPDALWNLLLRKKITYLNQTPTAFARNFVHCDNFLDDRNHSLRLIILGGESVKHTDLKSFVENRKFKKTKLYNMYGITEGTIHCTSVDIDLKYINANINNIGKLLSHVDATILDENGNEVPPGISGELCLGPNCSISYYWNAKHLNENRFFAGSLLYPNERWFRTGDIVKMNNDNTLEYIGRNDKQVKYNGYRIDIQEIEEALQSNKHIKQAIVTINMLDGVDRLIAFVVTDQQIDYSIIKESLITKLPFYMLPDEILTIESVPLTLNGKIDYKCLLNGMLTSAKYTHSSQACESITQTLIAIWSDVLQIEQKSLATNKSFFNLGGNSLLLVFLCERINKFINIKLSIVDLFKYPTIDSIANYLTYILNNDQQQPDTGMINNKEIISRRTYFNNRKVRSQLAQEVVNHGK